MNSHEYFNSVRRAATRRAEAESELSEIASGDTVSAVSYDHAGGSGSDMGDKVIGYMAKAEALEAEIARCERAMDAALIVLYGEGGVAKELGYIYADVLALHFIDRQSYREIMEDERECGGMRISSKSHVRYYCEAALAWLDKHSFLYGLC